MGVQRSVCRGVQSSRVAVVLATIDLMDDNRKYEVRGIFRGLIPITGGRQSQDFNSSSFFVLGYHWLPLETIYLVGDNREIQA